MLKGRSLLSLAHHSREEIIYLLNLAKELKMNRRLGKPLLERKNIALVFEKTSTRTRCAFEVAAMEEGANVTYLEPSASQIGHKESIADTARVLGRMYDAIAYRGYFQETVEELAKFSGVPVFNCLTDKFHPTQMLADLLTMQEHSNKALADISFAYLGDARNNMGNSLLLVGAKLGMDVRIIAPENLQPEKDWQRFCQEIAQQSGAKITITDDVKALKNVDFIHTDIWVSMGEAQENWDARIEAILPYRITPEIMQLSENPEVKFMHCLPAFHDDKTKVGQTLATQYPQFRNGIEVSNEVFESPQSIVFDQAENRMHTIKAVLVAALS